MSREKELVKNAAILSLGTFFPKFLTVLITPILTAQLLKAEYGQYDLITTIESLLLPAVTLQISSAAFRFLIDKKDNLEESKNIVSTIYAFVILSSVLVGTLYVLIARNAVGFKGVILILYFFFDILLQTTQQIIRGLGKNLLYSVSSIIRSVINVLLITVLTGFFHTKNFGLSGVVVAMVVATGSSLMFLVAKGKIWRLLSLKSIKVRKLKELLSYSWPMVPNNLSGWVLRLSDRIVITAVLGIEANAMYAVANKMPTILGYFQNTFSLAWQENASIASKDNDKDAYYSMMCDWIYRLIIGGLSVLIACTPVIWNLLVYGDYDEAYYQVPILYIGMLFQCMSLTVGGIYIAHMKTKSIGITTTIVAGLNFLIDIIFVRHIGIFAGSISTMVSYMFLLIYRMIDVQRFQKINFNIKKISCGVILLTLMAILNYQRLIFCDCINIAICIFTLVIFDRNIIIVLCRYIRKKISAMGKRKPGVR